MEAEGLSLAVVEYAVPTAKAGLQGIAAGPDGALWFAESDADNFSLMYAGEPDGLSKALVKTADYRAPSPPRWEEFLFYDHPSVEHRVRNAMEWKAKHMAQAPAAPKAPGG